MWHISKVNNAFKFYIDTVSNRAQLSMHAFSARIIVPNESEGNKQTCNTSLKVMQNIHCAYTQNDINMSMILNWEGNVIHLEQHIIMDSDQLTCHSTNRKYGITIALYMVQHVPKFTCTYSHVVKC